MSRAPLPASHTRRWSPDIAQEAPPLVPDLFTLLGEVTSFYDVPGNNPPKSAAQEQSRILDRLQQLLNTIPLENHVDRITLIVAAAILNPVRLDVDAERLGDHVKNSVEHEGVEAESNVKLRKYFHLPKLGLITKPTTILDRFGRILVWYLPGIMLDRLPEIATATQILHNLLAKSVHVNAERKGTWRVDPKYFVAQDEEPEFTPGSVDFAHSWFQARKERLVDNMTPSQTISIPVTLTWMDAIRDAEQDVNLLFSLIAPNLHNDGVKSVAKIKEANPHHVGVQTWPSDFNGIGVIVNRITPVHRDKGGRMEWYDLLVAAGSYTSAKLVLSDLGAELDYRPGTSVAVTGRLFRHGVATWEGGERICYAHYMRNNVLDRLEIQNASWVEEKTYTDWMSPKYLRRRAHLDKKYAI